MNCPPDIADALLDILTQGLLTARAAAWGGDCERSALETDHLHNLPSLLRNYSPQLLKFYWETQRRAYRAQVPAEDLGAWERLWARLEACGEGLREPTPAS
jgi:hypothetical protein